MSTALAGTPPLLRASLKYDGRQIAPWVVFVTFLSASSVLAYSLIFPTGQERTGLAATIGSNPALGLIFGPARDLTTVDGFNAWRSLALGGFIAALGAIFSVTRATRAQEDSGQAELLASGVLGRASRLFTGVAMASIGSLLLGVIAAVVTILCGGGNQASLLLAATFVVTGWMFAAVAAVTAQIGSDSRTANSMAVGVLGGLFMLRGFAYSVGAPIWTIWINPLGWMQQTHPATGDHWWPLLPGLALAVALLAVAFYLQARRDFGQGSIAARPGPDRGRDRDPLRLALRINRGPLIIWAVALLALGVVFGYFVTSLTDLTSNHALTHILASGALTPAGLHFAFLVTIVNLVGIIAAIPGVQTINKVRTEELEDRLEPILATAVSRPRYYASNVIVALAGPTLYMLLAGILIAILASSAGLGIGFGHALGQAAVTIPAMWTVIAVAATVIGARPNLHLAAWLGVLAAFVLTLLGPTFNLPDWALGINPFRQIPNVTATDADWLGPVWITLVTVAFLAIGFAGFTRRDVAR